jgi:cysteine desulfurase
MQAYLDNNTATRVPKEVVDAMLPYFTESYGNPSGLYILALEADEVIEAGQDEIANRIGAERGEITFTTGATEANNLAIRGVAIANKHRGKHMVTSKVEHPSVLNTFRALEKEGFEVTYIDVDEEGIVKLDELEKALRPDTQLVSIMAVNHVIGSMMPIKAIGELLGKRSSENKPYFHVDAAEMYGKLPISVQDAGIDMLSISGHMIHGPKGSGALYTRGKTRIRPQVWGSSSKFDLKPGVENTPAIAGLTKASQLAFEGMDGHLAHVRGLSKSLMDGIEDQIDDARLNGPTMSGGKRSPYNVNYTFKYAEGEAITLQLDMYGISVATGSACASQLLQVNYVLTAIGLKHEDAHGSIRFSLSRHNTLEEMDYTVQSLAAAYEVLKKVSAFKPS